MKKNFIQVISYGNNSLIKGKGIINSDISSPISPDTFSITIIDLRSSNYWCCNSNSYKYINCKQDLINLSTMVQQSKSTKVVMIYPQNIKFIYDYGPYKDGNAYRRAIELKNMLSILVKEFLVNLLHLPLVNLCYENTKTKINNFDLNASFYFTESSNCLTKSLFSNKPTTISSHDKVLTTLDISSYEEVINFLSVIGLISNKQEEPEWMTQITKFDDEEQFEIIKSNEEKIINAKSRIELAKQILCKNKEYKSILYTNGDELVKVVFDMLEQVMDYDLSEFVDEKKEDFIIKLDNVTFIGEIKGVTSNVKSEHISQLDVHLQSYLDKLNDNNIHENVKSLLIIGHQRKKDIRSREPIHINQINLANRNGSLIIETTKLLDLFEQFLNNLKTSAEIIELFTKKKGAVKF